jgi:hypothetical protein
MTQSTPENRNRSDVVSKIEEAVAQIEPAHLNGQSNVPALSHPAAQALVSGAMVHTAQAHDEVLSRIIAIEALCKTMREAIEKKRQEADRSNREFIDLATAATKHAEQMYAALKAAGTHLVEQESRL